MLDRRKQDDALADRIAERERKLAELQLELADARIAQGKADRLVLNLTNSIIGLFEGTRE